MTRPFIPFVHGAMARLRYSESGQAVPFSNVLHFETPGGFGGDELVTLAEAIRDWDLSDWRLLRPSGMTLDNIYVRALDAVESPAYDLNPGPGHSGGGGAAVSGWSCTKAIKLQSAYTGRSQRGRIFTPPISQAYFATSNQLSTLYLDRCITYVIHLISNLHALTPYMQLVIASYRTGHAWRTSATFVPVETAVVVGTRVDTQRRRLGPRPPV